MECFFQRHLPLVGGAVVVQFAHFNTPFAGGQVHGLGKKVAFSAPAVQQRVGVPEPFPAGQLGICRAAQGGQGFGAFQGGNGAHRDGIDLFFAR